VNIGDLLSYIAVVVALVAAGGLGLQRARVSNLDADLKRERGLTESLREEVDDLKRKRIGDQSQINELSIRLKAAEELATGEARWHEMNVNFQEHRTQLMAKLTALDRIEAAVIPKGTGR
jgi:hypothetical protein